MRAAVLREGRFEVREIPDPTPGPGEILVRTCACAICASDLHFMDHPEAILENDTGMQRYAPDEDIVMGHEYVAEIVDYGPNTERKWKPGTRVSSVPVLIRQGGPKIIGYNPETPGGFGEYFLMSEAITQVVPTDLPSELMCIADAMAVGWYYVRRANVQPNETPLVIGCGAIGLSAIAALKRRGIGPILAADFVESRRETALAMGADIVIDPAEISPFRKWKEIAYGDPDKAREVWGAVTARGCVVFECVGVPGVLDSIIKNCERETRIFSAGGAPQGDHIHTMVAKNKGLNIQFGGGPSGPDWNEAFQEVANGRLDVTPMLGRVVGLIEMPQAINDARDANGPARIVLDPRK
jgi:threonine dehydrogenase-like Zn-dependent dehydrogenase